MPICKREGFENFSQVTKEQTFHDNEEVFYCETTKQIFRDYEEYFRHVMVINSTIWQCEATKRENLTYAEALKSERRARKKREQFKDCLRPVVLLLIEKAQQASIKTLCRLAYAFIRSRFFVNEDVEALHKTSSRLKYVVAAVVPISPSNSPPDGGVYDPASVTYKLRKIGGVCNGKEHIIPHENIRRGRNEFCHDNLQMFIEDNVVRIEGILRPKPESYKKYVTDRKINFSKVYIGKLPYYEPSKLKKIGEHVEKKQSSMSKYLMINGEELAKPGETAEEETARNERTKTHRLEMERIQKEKEEKQANIERKKAERLAKIEEEATALAKKTDDLERYDQKPLPKFKTVSTYIPVKYFGDILMVQEFMHSFMGILSGINLLKNNVRISLLKNNVSFFSLTRAFTNREVSGTLSEIILVLLGTIFDLQQTDETKCAVEYTRVKHRSGEPYETMTKACKTHEFVRRQFSHKLNTLPLDAQSLSEVLRLHFLASGAQVNEKAERWRAKYRNEYYSSEDPGLVFRMQQPHVLRALNMYTVYQLPMMEILRIIHTLIAQILTYQLPLIIIEKRMEQTAKSKIELRTILAAENRRTAGVEMERKKLVADYALLAKEQPSEAKQIEEKLNKKVSDLLSVSGREKKKFEAQLDKLHKSLLVSMAYLGMDRAYRKYYVLESMPGVFVEHSPECHDTCLENPPKNVPHLVGCPRTLREIRMHLSKLYPDEDDPVRKKRRPQPAAVAQDNNKENKENEAVMNGGVKLNGDAIKIEVDDEVDVEPVVPETPPTQYELMMCTGDPKNCIVHDEKNPDRQRWAFFHTEEDLNALIASLNPLGDRENILKEQLNSMRTLIVSHIRNCPVSMLSIEDKRKNGRYKSNVPKFGFSADDNLNVVMFGMLVDRILQMELDITTGDLGSLKVKDVEKWRQDIQNNTYDPQAELSWGLGSEARTYEDPGLNLGETLEIDSEDSADEGISLHDSSILRQCVKNLSSALLQVEQSIKQRFLKEPFGISKESREKDKMDALLEKGRERLKYWETSLMNAVSYSQVFLHLNILHGAIKWQRSTNKSCCQICRRMTDPKKMLLCDECNAGTHMFCMKPKMKTVPEGNWYCKRCAVKHKFNDEPKKIKRKRVFLIDEEDNGSDCSLSRSNGRIQSKHLRTDEIEEELCDDNESVDVKDEEPVEEAPEDDEEVEEEEEDMVEWGEEEHDEEAEEEQDEELYEEADEEEDEELDDTQEDPLTAENDPEEDEESTIEEDEEICVVCSYNGGEIACAGCKSVYHLDCVDLKRPPRSNWNCNTCKTNLSKKRKSKKNDNSSDDDEYDQPLVKRSRQSTSSSKRSSMRISMHDSFGSGGADEVIRGNNNNSRRSRRAADHLPLNSSILYDLLDDIMKHDSSWPFLRPVSHAEVPDYHTIIKEPMDFAKVKSKLNMGKYTINEELLKDIELIFKNCDIYNQEGNEIYEAGSSLERFVMERCKGLHLPFQPSDMNRS